MGSALTTATMKSACRVTAAAGAGSEDTAVAAMKAGAVEYVVKDAETNYLKVLPSNAEMMPKTHSRPR